MNRLHLVTVFVAVAEAQSFAAAARRLGMSPPAVTRAVAALEAHLGVKLLARTTRFVRATEVGLRYLEDVRGILTGLEDADRAAVGAKAEPRGHLAVTAPMLFGRLYVAPVIVEFLNRYPAVRASALLVDRVVNLVEEGQDVGIRIGELPDSTLNAIGVGHVRRVVCATPKYLKRHGTPATPEDLAAHSVIAASSMSPVAEWRFVKGGRTYKVKINPRLTVSGNDAAVEAALRGFGLTQILSYQVAPYLASGKLKVVLSDHESSRLPVHVLHREGRTASARVRAFVDLLVTRLRADPGLN